MEFLLHAGHEHPATLWIAVSAVISFVLGIGVGAFGTGRRSAEGDDHVGESDGE
ncbi:hypothetical protein J2751_001541 [Halorubrum alkaliphilum]|uniref:Uncharacterized protein n=1 Tax=Halorubrum alkaliphilum TaxID=261290 RepID=A0A8T4GGG5_9EURY|nr:hypothetical protein [Halorubrum alkaliphilum]MBP1922531.1 hypothetical protein [Halorubrum alkaliphilum]